MRPIVAVMIAAAACGGSSTPASPAEDERTGACKSLQRLAAEGCWFAEAQPLDECVATYNRDGEDTPLSRQTTKCLLAELDCDATATCIQGVFERD